MYDPLQKFSEADFLAVEHFFIDWNDLNGLEENLNYSEQRKRRPMISLEPWPKQAADKDQLLEDIIQGRYDSQIDASCRAFKNFNQPIFVRWGHEMEVINGRYPWAAADHKNYIEAYRHFVSQCRRNADNIFYVWSPAGNKELAGYYPGREFVDYIGLSVYGFPEWDRVRNFDRPVMIAELGVKGDERYQAEWLDTGFSRLSEYPLLKSAVYFNSVDNVNVWGENYATPDWSLSKKLFE